MLGMKRCSVCKVEWPLDQFHRDKNRKDGRHLECRGCRSRKAPPRPIPTEKRCSACRETKPMSEFHAANESVSRHKRQAYCKPCAAEIGRQRRLADPDYSRRITERGYFRAYRWRRIEQRYGLSRGEYEALLMAQGELCAVCRGTNNGKHLVVDHDHSSGLVRGLLCGGCNHALGFVEKDGWIESANAYLSSAGVRGSSSTIAISM